MNVRHWILLLVPLLAQGTAPAAESSLRDFIDAEIAAGWKSRNLTPSAAASDAEFVRRVHLDLVGVIPSFEDTKAFLADTDPEKRAKLIDRLLADDRYGAAQAILWDQVMFGRDPPGDDSMRRRDGFVKFLRTRFAENAPYDQLVRELLMAEGNSVEQGAPLFLAQFRNKPEDAAVAVTRLFMGIQLQCARCHDHPTEKWTQKDFYGVAAFFARLRVVDTGKADRLTKYVVAETRTGDVLFTGIAKDQKPGMKGEPIKPKYLSGEPLAEPEVPKDYKEPKAENGKVPPKPDFSRKEKLAAWVATPENPFFARAAVNRIWAQFMGRGLVDPVDDFSPSVQPSHPKLLDEMTAQFVAKKFDLKWLIREIVSSKAYQISSAGLSTEANPQAYDRARVRPLSAEEFLASLRAATGIDKAEKQGTKINYNAEYFTRYFGEPVNGRGVFQGSIDEHLFLNNSPDVQNFTRSIKGNLTERLITSTEPVGVQVEQMFLSVLARMPTDVERDRFTAFIDVAGAKDLKEAKHQAFSRAIWVLLNTAEFRFNH